MINRKVLSDVARVITVFYLLVWCVMVRAEQVAGEQKFMSDTFRVSQSGGCSITPPERLELTQEEATSPEGKYLGDITVECPGATTGYQTALAVSKDQNGPYDATTNSALDGLNISIIPGGSSSPNCKQLDIPLAGVQVNCWVTNQGLGNHHFPLVVHSSGEIPVPGTYTFYLIGTAYIS
ncbi:TPA: hypothetical protein KNH08_001898 [Serratia fonticola]|nr:hypothetical protein [Serratia fonticola]